jgi:hypothetical protein
MIKNLIVAATLATTSASADTTIVNTGSDSGGFNAVLSMVADKLDGNVIQAGNPVIAASYFNKGDVVTMWSTEWPGDDSLPKPAVDENTIVALQTYETIMCSRLYTAFSQMEGDTIKVATWGESPAVNKFLADLGEANNITFEVVPYEGSGGTTRGYLGGDADTIFTIQTRQAKVEADGTCFAFSAQGDLDFAFIDMILAVNASEDVVNNLRNVVTELAATEAWQTSFEGTVTYVVDDTNAADIVAKTNAAIALNSN